MYNFYILVLTWIQGDVFSYSFMFSLLSYILFSFFSLCNIKLWKFLLLIIMALSKFFIFQNNSFCFGKSYYYSTWHTVIHYRPTNICSHIISKLITHRCTIIGYFNKCNFSKHEWWANWRWCDCAESCQNCFNVNFNIVFKTITCALVGE